VLCQLAGQYAVDGFIGSTLQMDADANSSTVTTGRLAGLAARQIWDTTHMADGIARKRARSDYGRTKPIVRGRKLVVQTVETFQSGRRSCIR